MARWSRWALLVSCFAGLAYALSVYAVSPESVPLHYGLAGQPDRFGKPSELLAVHVGVIVFGSGLFGALPALVGRLPAALVNIPHRQYWLAPERRQETTRKLAVWSSAFGTSLNLLVVVMQALLGSAARSATAAPLLVVVGFCALAIASCVWLARSFRLPTRAA